MKSVLYVKNKTSNSEGFVVVWFLLLIMAFITIGVSSVIISYRKAHEDIVADAQNNSGEENNENESNSNTNNSLAAQYPIIDKQIITPSTSNQTIKKGYHDGSGYVLGDIDLIADNIVSGISIFGVIGTAQLQSSSTTTAYTYGDSSQEKVLTTASGAGTYNATNLSVGTVKSGTSFGVGLTGEYPSASYPLAGSGTVATASEIISGKVVWNNAGTQLTGTMPTQTLSAANDTVTTGYYAATTLATIDTDLVTGNILSGKTIFGVAGNSNVVNTSTGTATASDLLSGKIAWVNGSAVTGTISTNTLSALNDTVTAGYYAATTLVTVDSDLVTGNIRSGINIFGIDGNANVVNTSTGDAIAADILFGKIAWVDGSEITGNISTNTLSAANDTVSAGYYAATTLATVDTDLVTGNILSGKTIFGVAGNSNVVNTSTGDATAADILFGKIAWVDGSEITGSMATQTLSADSLTLSAGYYTATTLSTVDSDLTAANIKSGATVFGLAGTAVAGSACSTQEYHDGYASATEENNCSFTWTTASPAVTGDDTSGNTDPLTGLTWSNYLRNNGGIVEFNTNSGSTWSWDGQQKFTVTAANATAGATYTNNSQTYTVVLTISGGTTLYTIPTGTSEASGALTKTSGTGDDTITFSSRSGDADNIAVGGKTASELCSERGDGWRLPTQKELQQAYIDGAYWNLTQPTREYWSATSFNSTYAHYVNLANGSTNSASKTSEISVRCVR